MSQEMDLEDFIFGHPAQIALLGIQFQWTADTQDALTRSKTDKTIMNKNLKKTDALLRDMVNITVKTDLTKIQRTNLETCVTVHMHQKESTEDLVKKKIKDPTDFEWLKQCRFYWREDKDTVIISICDVDFEYSFEYLGVKERLVITPLTDICYITLSQVGTRHQKLNIHQQLSILAALLKLSVYKVTRIDFQAMGIDNP